jgi:hypothetical protein
MGGDNVRSDWRCTALGGGSDRANGRNGSVDIIVVTVTITNGLVVISGPSILDAFANLEEERVVSSRGILVQCNMPHSVHSTHTDTALYLQEEQARLHFPFLAPLPHRYTVAVQVAGEYAHP